MAATDEFRSDFLIIKSKVCIVVSEFNQYITKMLHEGAYQILIERGLTEKEITTYWVPGAFEIPMTCKRILSSSKEVDGIIALGAVIKGKTPHFNYVAENCARGIMNVSLEFSKPIIFGVLTTYTVEQSLKRASAKLGNNGAQAAESLLKLLHIFQKTDI